MASVMHHRRSDSPVGSEEHARAAVTTPSSPLEEGHRDVPESLFGDGEGASPEKKTMKQAYFSRWVVLSVAMAIAYATGSAYDFGLYSDELQDNLGYSENAITLLASFANAGLYSMILSGLCLELVGPRYNLLVGGLCSAVGYLCLWAIATGNVSSTLGWSVLSLYLATFGTSFFSVTCTTLIVANFPTRDRGKAVGLMKGFLGLGISINSQFYTTFFGDLDYLLGLAIVLPLVALIGASTVNYVPRAELEYSIEESAEHNPCPSPFAPLSPRPGKRHVDRFGRRSVNFWMWFALVGVTAVWVGTATYLEADLVLAQWADTLLFLPTLLLTLLGLAWFPFQYGPLKRMGGESSLDEGEGGGSETSTLLDRPRGTGAEVEEDFTLLQMLSTLEFWLLFLVFAMGAGVCLTVVNNIAGLVDATASGEGTAIPLMLFGLFETAGRLSVALSDSFRSCRVARIFLLDGVLILLFLCCLLLAYADEGSLNICVVLVSYCYGFLYADMSAITADLFGVRHFGANLGFFLFAPILGSFAFASGVVDLFYVEGCSGSACYRYVFLTEAVACLVATVLCLFLKLRIMDRFQVTSLGDIFQQRRSSQEL